MNIGITTSFIVGGLLMLSILHMNYTVSNNSRQSTMQMIAKTKQQTISQTITADFQRMGYGVKENEPVITFAGSEKIVFKATIGGSKHNIIWQFNSSAKYKKTENPNDYKLRRTGPVANGKVSTTFYSVVSFNLTYYDMQGNETTAKSKVDKIKVKIVTESPQPLTSSTGKKEYGRSFWQRTIVPSSLHIRNMQTN